MVIKLRCPEGHPVTCPDDKVGHTGKCPKCGSAFRVPDPQRTGISELNGAEPVEDVFVFLCPNGHKLNGPSSLQGKPGQCPHCSARFVIPDFVEQDEEAYEAGNSNDEFWDDDTNDEVLEEIEAIEPLPDDASRIKRRSSSQLPATRKTNAAAHPLFELFELFWEHKKHGATIELHLKSGEMLHPLLYSRERSQGPYGLFTIPDESGTPIMTAIAWDSISRIAVAGAARLPEIFDT